MRERNRLGRHRLIRFNGNSFNVTATSLVEDFPANFLTTWPRLMIEQTGRRWILCQLMSAIQTPGGVHNFAMLLLAAGTGCGLASW